MSRSLAKTLTFALVHFTVAFGLVYSLTGSLPVAGAVALLEPLVNTVAFFFHERVWERIGRRAGQARPGDSAPAGARHAEGAIAGGAHGRGAVAGVG